MAYPKITPLGNHVLIRRDDPAAQVGLIIIPDSAQKKADRGTVVAVGRGRRAENGTIIPCDCAVGDVVVFPPQLGAEVTVDGLKYTLLTDDAVIGIVDAFAERLAAMEAGRSVTAAIVIEDQAP